MLGGVQVNVGGVQNMLGGCTNEVGGVRTPPHPPRKSASGLNATFIKQVFFVQPWR